MHDEVANKIAFMFDGFKKQQGRWSWVGQPTSFPVPCIEKGPLEAQPPFTAGRMIFNLAYPF